MVRLPSRRLWPALLAAASSVSAQQPPPPPQQQQQLSTFPVDNVSIGQKNSAMTLQISAPSGPLSLTYDVVPFTKNAGLNRSNTERGLTPIQGPIKVATESTYTDIANPSIAYLSCDRRNTSFVTSDVMLAKLMENRPRAIILYSQQDGCCGVLGLSENMPYVSIFTMTDAAQAGETLNMTNSGLGWVQATITGNVTAQDSDSMPGGGGSNSAVAMSVLYSITGLITLLFLVIIGTGAIRAHRYPERYGPRSGYGGRPRQSRAKGIARAVLDTLPIVKFGSPQQQQQQKAGDDIALEMGDASDRQRQRRKGDQDTVQAHHLSTIPEDAEAVPSGNNAPTRESRVPTPPESAVATGETGPEQPAGDDEHLGCTICTEDFEVGEDVRVLPCDHKFHPPCIDPWLINVSGTCPLCRLDLQPRQSETEGNDSDGGNEPAHMPPPLGPDSEHDAVSAGGASASPSQHSRRSSRFFFDLNRLRHASAEERIEALRRYRTESRAAAGGERDGEEQEERSRRSRLTQRLRDKFRVRTQAQSPPQAERRPLGAGATP